MKHIQRLKDEFFRIKKLGYVENTRPNNKDGGIGNTFEDLLGVEENNRREADFEGIEIKSQRYLNSSSYISLFTKSPDYPNKANSYLRETYGELRDENHPEKKKLYASIFGNKYSKVYSKYKMKLKVNRKAQKIELEIKNLKDKFLDNVSWNFETIKKASEKLNVLCLVFAEEKIENKEKYCYFTKANILCNFGIISLFP